MARWLFVSTAFAEAVQNPLWTEFVEEHKVLAVYRFRWEVTVADISKHLADIKKYTTAVDEKAVQGMAKTYALVMSKSDTQFVAASDPAEVQRVVDGFCKKKLGRKEDDKALTDVVKAQCEKMKADRTKSRLTVYYLIAEHFKQLAMFYPK
jgi:hypothetical protein